MQKRIEKTEEILILLKGEKLAEYITITDFNSKISEIIRQMEHILKEKFEASYMSFKEIIEGKLDQENARKQFQTKVNLEEFITYQKR